MQKSKTNPLLSRTLIVLLLLVLVVVVFAESPNLNHYSYAISSTEFSSANSALNSAFAGVQSAEKSGGNVTLLVSQLNAGITLLDKARAENVTNPSQASSDLQNAISLAQQVSSESSTFAQAGISRTRTIYAQSVGSAVGVIMISVLIYLYGDRIYRRIWFFLYRNYGVKPAK